MVLIDDDELLFTAICRRLNIPIQTPVSVKLFKKVLVTDKPTGRVIEYRSDLKCNSFVAVNQGTLNSESRFGQIQSLFSYRAINFVSLKTFECTIHNFSSLLQVTDCTMHSKAIYLLEEVSRPLVVAMTDSAAQEIWILNA